MSIIDNKKAFHDYHVEDRHEAGLMLEGWEVKAIRAGRAQLKESYVIVKGDEIFLFGCHISPLPSTSGFTNGEPTRTRKLLLHRAEIEKMIVKVSRSGYTMVPINLHYKAGRIKLDVGMAKGKKQHDKRDADKERDQKREVQQALKQNSR
jgi:SsrA-binding protein